MVAKSQWPCFCGFWGATCAHCKMAQSLDPRGREIECVPVEVKPAKKRAKRKMKIAYQAKGDSDLIFTGDKVLLIDPITNEPIGA